MRYVTFTALAMILGKERPVALIGPKEDGSMALSIGGLTADDAQQVVAALEGGTWTARQTEPAKADGGKAAPVKDPPKPKDPPEAKPAPAAKADTSKVNGAAAAAPPEPAAKPAAAAEPAKPPKPAAAPAKPPAEKPAAAPAKAALDPVGPSDGDGEDDEKPAAASPSVDDDPWGLSTTKIPQTVVDAERLRDVIAWVKQHALAASEVELTEDQVVAAVESLRGKVPLVTRIPSDKIPTRVHGVIQVLGDAGARPTA